MGGASCTISGCTCEQASIVNKRVADVDMTDDLAMHRDILTHHVPAIVRYEGLASG